MITTKITIHNSLGEKPKLSWLCTIDAEWFTDIEAWFTTVFRALDFKS